MQRLFLSVVGDLTLRQGTSILTSLVSNRTVAGLTDNSLTFVRKVDNIAAEAALDGLYIMRTSVKAERMDAPTCVRTYKSPAQVERAFRSLKTMDLGACYPSPSGGSGACAYLAVHAGLLRGVAHAPGVARVDVCRL